MWSTDPAVSLGSIRLISTHVILAVSSRSDQLQTHGALPG